MAAIDYVRDDPVIRARDLTKVYRVYRKPEHRLIQMATLGRVRPFREFSAVNGVSLEIRHGETVGIVGRNGCGKSTLLQMICGTLQPTSGSLDVTGRVAALLELGAGFNPDFTGRENVYLNGAILGFSKAEMTDRFDDILRFAAIGDFIEQPVRTYSSGMYVRLAFAVAISAEPDILVVDEALSVGDEAFQRKCFARIEQIKARGATILFVSHAAQTVVQLCDRAILLDAGEKLLEGEPKIVVGQYQRLVNASPEAAVGIRTEIQALRDGYLLPSPGAAATNGGEPTDQGLDAEAAHVEEEDIEEEDTSAEIYNPDVIPESTIVYEENGLSISEVKISNKAGKRVNVLVHGREYVYSYRCRALADLPSVSFAMLIKTKEGYELFARASHSTSNGIDVREGQTFEISFPFNCLLLPGAYFCNAGVTSNGETCHRIVDAAMFYVAPMVSDQPNMRTVNLARSKILPEDLPITVMEKHGGAA